MIIQNTNKKTELWEQLSHAHSTSFPQITQEIAAKLIDQMSSKELSIPDKYGRTPLNWIVSRGWKRETQALLSKLSIDTINKISYLESSVLHVATYYGYIEVAKILLNSSPTLINNKDENGETPLHYAAKKNDSEIIEYFLQENSNLINVTDNKYGRTILHMAAECGCEKVTQILLKLSPNLADKVDNWGWTPLHLAVRYGGNIKIVKMLLHTTSQILIDKSVPDYPDVTVLSLAISSSIFYNSSNEHEQVIEILLNSTSLKSYIIVKSAPFAYKERGAKPIDNSRTTSDDLGEFKSFDYTSDKDNILHRAITSGNERVIAMILNKIIKENIILSQECINKALDIANNTRYGDIYRNKNIVKLIKNKLSLEAKENNKENIQPNLSNQNHDKKSEYSKLKEFITAINTNNTDNTVNAVKLIAHMSSKELSKSDKDGATLLHWAAAKTTNK